MHYNKEGKTLKKMNENNILRSYIAGKGLVQLTYKVSALDHLGNCLLNTSCKRCETDLCQLPKFPRLAYHPRQT